MKYTYLFFRISDGLTKIGRTSFPSQRFEQLGGEKNLKVISVIEGDSEKAMHERFAEFRVSGEWFKLSDEILHGFSVGYSKYFPMREVPMRRINVTQKVTYGIPIEIAPRLCQLIIRKAELWKCIPSEALMRILDELAAKDMQAA